MNFINMRFIATPLKYKATVQKQLLYSSLRIGIFTVSNTQKRLHHCNNINMIPMSSDFFMRQVIKLSLTSKSKTY